jgi:hypothetical protein
MPACQLEGFVRARLRLGENAEPIIGTSGVRV